MTGMDQKTAEQGSVLVTAVGIMVLLLAFGALTMTYGVAAFAENREAHEHVRRLYLAEMALDAAILDLDRGGDGSIASAGNPVITEQGEYWVESTDNGDQTFTLRSYARIGPRSRGIEAIVVERGRVFDHALFAGNSSGDPNYELTFEGLGKQADKIKGDIYSGNDVLVDQDADVDGLIRARGFVTGVKDDDKEEGVTQPVFNIAGMNYENRHDVNVAAEFAAGATWRYDDAGGSAWQLPESNPAHIFRKNPNDRTSDTSSTVKDDYFLEDPYEPVRSDSKQNGSDCYQITPGARSDEENVRLLYYIDGNLWVHNARSFSLQFRSEGKKGSRVTIVVKGNIYISDNLFYDDAGKDGLALIAIKDENVSDSGNVYFGDPRFGTLEYMDAFMYAEEDFVDNNLSAVGSKEVVVKGTMAAGDHVRILRTYSETAHSKLEVEWDKRLQEGQLDLPGLPRTTSRVTYEVVTWRLLPSGN